MFQILQVFLVVVLMVNHMDGANLKQSYDLIEFFSGSARISRLASARGFSAVAVDMIYDNDAPPPRTSKKNMKNYPYPRNAMDLNTSAGFVLLVFMGFRVSFFNPVARC